MNFDCHHIIARCPGPSRDFVLASRFNFCGNVQTCLVLRVARKWSSELCRNKIKSPTHDECKLSGPKLAYNRCAAPNLKTIRNALQGRKWNWKKIVWACGYIIWFEFGGGCKLRLAINVRLVTQSYEGIHDDDEESLGNPKKMKSLNLHSPKHSPHIQRIFHAFDCINKKIITWQIKSLNKAAWLTGFRATLAALPPSASILHAFKFSNKWKPSANQQFNNSQQSHLIKIN